MDTDFLPHISHSHLNVLIDKINHIHTLLDQIFLHRTWFELQQRID